MNIVFFGTPDFAVATLKALHESHHNIVAVVTSTDKMGGRGKSKLLESDVKKYALHHNLPILQPKNLKNQDFIETLKSYKADIQAVVAFRMLPEVVWNMPAQGTINLHASLLPKYRGAAPINWAVINGEKYTGITTFKLQHAIDTGNIILQKEVQILDHDTAGSLYNRMKDLGGPMMVETMNQIESNTAKYTQQDDSLVSKAPKIYHADCEINWNQEITQIQNFIRGMAPYPTAWTRWNEKQFNCYGCTKSALKTNGKPGTFFVDQKKLYVNCKDFALELTEVQVAGSRRSEAHTFINGFLNKEDAPMYFS